MEISVIIIAKNEQEKISKCFESVKWASEILLFDDGSNDKTSKIAKKFGAEVFSVPKGDFSSRKNYAFSKSKSDWIFSLDADERVTPELKNEIFEKISHHTSHISDPVAYAIPRKNIILGKEFKHGGQWPDYVVRLFKNDRYVKWSGELHEQPIFDGKLGYLKNPIIHIKHDKLSEMVQKSNDWSEVEAKLMFEAKHPIMNLRRFFTAMFREFYTRIIKQKSFLDGGEGVIYALYQVFSRFLSYAKLWEMQLHNKI